MYENLIERYLTDIAAGSIMLIEPNNYRVVQTASLNQRKCLVN